MGTPEVVVRDMLPEDEAFIGTCAHVGETEEKDACGHRRVAWLRDRIPHGVRSKVATVDGRRAGFLYVVPIELSPWGPIGEDLLVLPCLFVVPEETKQGIGRLLVADAEAEVERQGRKGLVAMACNHEAWFMPRAFFEELGFEVADRRGMEVVLWKRRSPDAEPPRLLGASYRFRPKPGKVVIDLFWNRFCLTSELEADRVREVAAEFGDDVELNQYDATDPAVLQEHQIPRAIFVQGEQITWGFEAPKEGLREAIRAAHRR